MKEFIYTDNKQLRNELKELINTSNYKNTEIAEKMGISRQNYNNIINVKKNINCDDIKNILDVIDYDLIITFAPKKDKKIPQANNDDEVFYSKIFDKDTSNISYKTTIKVLDKLIARHTADLYKNLYNNLNKSITSHFTILFHDNFDTILDQAFKKEAHSIDKRQKQEKFDYLFKPDNILKIIEMIQDKENEKNKKENNLLLITDKNNTQQQKKSNP